MPSLHILININERRTMPLLMLFVSLEIMRRLHHLTEQLARANTPHLNGVVLRVERADFGDVLARAEVGSQVRVLLDQVDLPRVVLVLVLVLQFVYEVAPVDVGGYEFIVVVETASADSGRQAEIRQD